MTATLSNPIAQDFRKVLGHFPTGVTVITGAGPDGPVGLTIQSFMSLSLDPALILISIDHKSKSWPVIAEGSKFAVNVLSAGQEGVAMAFARSGGPKYEGVEWTPGPRTGAPLLQGAQAWIECEIWRTYDGGDHEIIVGSVLDLSASADPESHPLLFTRSKFAQLDRDHWNSLTQ